MSLFDLLDDHIFSGITGNIAHEVLKNVWSRITQRSWEQLYLDSFEQAMEDMRPRLAAYAAGGEVAVDRDELARALHRDLYIGPNIARLNTLTNEEFIAALADAMVERSVVSVGEYPLSRDDYAQICRNLIKGATQRFRQAILADADTFRQALLVELEYNTDLVQRILQELEANASIWRDDLDLIKTSVAEISQKTPTLSQVREVLREELASLVRPELTAEQHLREQLVTERERRWNDQYERLRRVVDDGYIEGVRDAIIALIDELQQQIAEGIGISPALQGSIYRLGAIAFLPSRPGGDVSRARAYLRLARPHSTGEAALKCEIIDAVLLDVSHGMGSALDQLAGLEGDEPLRLRFALAVQHDELDTCERMIADGQVDPDTAISNPLWARPLMFYYAGIGQRTSLLACVDQLIATRPTADHLEAVGLALTRAAFAMFGRFCRDHRILPEYHYGLDLEPLIDVELRERAIRYFERAAEGYAQHGCPSDAVRTVVSAIRLLMDTSEDARRNRLLDRLRELDPAHMLLTTSAVGMDDTQVAESLVQLESAFADREVDPLLLLHRARQIGQGAVNGRQVIELLVRHEQRFRGSPLTQLQYEIGVLEFLQEVGTEAEAEAWLARVSTPAPYEHMRPLCHIAFYMPRNTDAARHWVEQARAVAPNQPEVLLAAAGVFGKAREYASALDAAEQLFALLRTRQTAILRLRLLQRAGRFRELLDLLAQIADLGLDEVDLRSFRAEALVALGQPQDALLDLEWLVERGQAHVHGIMSLAQIYVRLHRHAEAVSILRRCIERYADEPASRLLLSRILLVQGQREESFRVAVQARQRFPEDAAVASHLIQVAFPSGHEDAPEVQSAIQALVSEQPFPDTVHLRLVHVEDARAMLTAALQTAQEVDRLYTEGQIPLVLRCYQTRTPLCWYHTLVRERTANQLVAPWGGHDVSWWETRRLTAVVIDYPALLTLRSLFGAALLALLRASVDRIYLPTTLLDMLAWEQTELAAQGQRLLEQHRAQVQNRLRELPGRLFLHNSPPETVGTDTIAAAALLSANQQLAYLTAYAPPVQALGVPALDLPALADILLHGGEISPIVAERLREQASQVATSSVPALQQGAPVVTNTLTLIAIQQAGALDALLTYCSQIHLLQNDWNELSAQVVTTAWRERTRHDLDLLQALIAQGINEGFIHMQTLSPDELVLQMPDADDDHEQLRDLVFAYTNELFSLAYLHQVPLWTDDRWTAVAGLPDHITIDRVGTDTMLRWLFHHGLLADRQAYSAYANLISWAYQGQAINEGYLRWLVRQGMQASSRPLIDTTTRYRVSLLGLWTTFDPQSAYGQQSYLVYLRAFAETIMGCFNDGASAQVAGSLIRDLDVSQDWPALIGNEPAHLSDVLLRMVGLMFSSGEPRVVLDVRRLSQFSEWLDAALHHAGFRPMFIAEAWHRTFEHVLRLYDSFVAEHNQVADDALLLKIALRTAPEHVLDRLLASNLAPNIRSYAGNILKSEMVLTIRQSDGTTTQFAYPQQQWERDHERAVNQAVLQNNSEPVVAGIITLHPVRNHASLWLRYSLVPTAKPELFGVPKLVRPEHMLELFSRFGHLQRPQRKAVWQIGRKRLGELGLPTGFWDQLRLSLLSTDARVWRSAAQTAIRALFGEWAFVRANLDEALSLGLPALFDILTRLEPEDVRAWLGLQARFDADALRRWAEHTAGNLTFTGERAAISAQLADYLARYGHSLFPDALVRRARVVRLIVGMSDVQQQRLILQELLEQAQDSKSRTLKANSVLIAIACLEQVTWEVDEAPVLHTIIAELIVDITAQLDSNDPQTAAVRVIAQVARYFYERWSASSRFSTNELAYLAHIAACWIGEVLGRRLPNDAMEQVNDALAQDTHGKDARPVPQPSGVFRPRWAGLLNYNAALLLGTSSLEGAVWSRLRENQPIRSALLYCGAQYRVLQAVLNVTAIRRGWLDQDLAADIPGAVADLFASLDESALNGWSADEQYALMLCRVPDAGSILLEGMIERIPEQTDDANVQNTVGVALLNVGEPGGAGDVALLHLLAPAQLARIQQYPDCHAFLMWRLTSVLARPADHRAELVAGIRTAIYTLPDDLETVSVTATTVTSVLLRRAMAGQLLDDLADWLMYLGADEEIPLVAVRAALDVLLYWWAEIPSSSRKRLRPPLNVLARAPHLSRLWELRRLYELV